MLMQRNSADFTSNNKKRGSFRTQKHELAIAEVLSIAFIYSYLYYSIINIYLVLYI